MLGASGFGMLGGAASRLSMDMPKQLSHCQSQAMSNSPVGSQGQLNVDYGNNSEPGRKADSLMPSLRLLLLRFTKGSNTQVMNPLFSTSDNALPATPSARFTVSNEDKNYDHQNSKDEGLRTSHGVTLPAPSFARRIPLKACTSLMLSMGHPDVSPGQNPMEQSLESVVSIQDGVSAACAAAQPAPGNLANTGAQQMGSLL